jgi:hypothetical protein
MPAATSEVKSLTVRPAGAPSPIRTPKHGAHGRSIPRGGKRGAVANMRMNHHWQRKKKHVHGHAGRVQSKGT